MMGQIREEAVGFLFNLEVEVNTPAGEVDAPSVQAKGLETGHNEETAQLSYTAPSDSGGVEVRNQRGQLEQAATARAQRAQDEAANRGGAQQPVPPVAPTAPAAGQAAARARTGGQPQRPAPTTTGAFGQKTPAGAPPASNRADRRAGQKKK